MGIHTTYSPDVSSGALVEFGFHKVQRHTKDVINNMLENYFSIRSKAYGIVVPEILSLQNKPGDRKVHIRRDFVSQERKFPAIMTTISKAVEKRVNIGADDLLYIRTDTTPDGEKVGVDVHAGMADIDLMLIVAATSPDERSMLAELVFNCFTHYYRGHFIYQDENDGMFAIVPATKPIDFGRETEVTDESKTTLIYLLDLGISATIEYHFADPITDGKWHEVAETTIDEDSGPVEE